MIFSTLVQHHGFVVSASVKHQDLAICDLFLDALPIDVSVVTTSLGKITPTMYVYVNYKIVYYTHTPLSVISGCFEKHCISIGQTRNSMCKY